MARRKFRKHAEFVEFMELRKNEITSDYVNGDTLRQIASDYEISETQVWKFLSIWGVVGHRSGRSGKLYIIIAVGTPYCKVGFTEFKIERRLRYMQNGCPYKLEIARVFEKQTVLVERRCHKKLMPYRVRGEWFKRCAGLDMLISGTLSLDRFLEMSPSAKQQQRRQLSSL